MCVCLCVRVCQHNLRAALNEVALDLKDHVLYPTTKHTLHVHLGTLVTQFNYLCRVHLF